MAKLKALQSDALTHLEKLQASTTEFIRGSPLVTGAVLGVGSTIGAIGVAKVGMGLVSKVKARKKTVKKRRKATPIKRKRRKTRKGIKRRRFTPRTAGKLRDRSTRRIRQTKHGQPYVILANGRARFIKRSSARRSRRLKGGRY